MNHKPTTGQLGNIVLFEHVNTTVPDHRLAHLFYLEGLGFTRDPYRMTGTRNMWVNLGVQQFHLPLGDPQPLDAELGVVVPDLKHAQARLERVAPVLNGTQFDMRRENGTLAVTNPWGVRFRVHGHGTLPGRMRQAMPYVEFHVPPGTARPIAAFYEEVLGCPARHGKRKEGAVAEVQVGPHQTFWFLEREGALANAHNNHVAVYLTRYDEVYAALRERDLIMEADANEQFRFCDLIDPRTGKVVYTLEHEMRSLYHADYRRPLANRVPVEWPVE